KSLALALAIVGVAGLSMASAAQLTVNSSDIAAGVDTVAACDAAVTVAYAPTYSAGPPPGYTVNAVTIGDIDAACAGANILVTVTDINDVSLANGSATAAGGSVPVTLSGTVNVADIYGVAVAIG
ncbi:MAG: hypothetical protein MUP36_01245, partial [Demequinaceae bacterium]|nr:hypothetical protein [Demequinaceae bacterium]